jgi:hypothetical protein
MALKQARREGSSGVLEGLKKAGHTVERTLTPTVVIAAVIVAAAIVLIVSQFLDYREVQAGVPAYRDVSDVVAAPRVPGSVATAGSAHAYLMIPLALAAIVLTVGALGGRWRLARLVVLAGLIVIAISLLVDVPKGLDEGNAAVQFEGAEARLLGAFWAQLSAGVVIAACGVLLGLELARSPAHGRRGAGRRPRRSSETSRRAARRSSGVEGARP